MRKENFKYLKINNIFKKYIMENKKKTKFLENKKNLENFT